MELTGTTGNTATFSFRPWDASEFWNYKNIETFQVFQRKDSAYSIPTTSIRKAYWVSREVNRQNLLAGAVCQYDHEWRSKRWDRIWRGQSFGQSCLTSYDWEYGMYCKTNSTISQYCEYVLVSGSNWTEGTDICEPGYYWANVNSTGSKCVELFSQPDGSTSTQEAVWVGGFKTSGNVCFSVKYAAATTGTTQLASPYSWNITSGISSCKALDASNTSQSNTIPWLCGFTTDKSQGYCAYTGGANDYTNYFASLKLAVKSSKYWNNIAYKWIFDYNLLSSNFFSSTIGTSSGFADWYQWISHPSVLDDYLTNARSILGYPGSASTVYSQCLSDQSLDIYNPRHWCSNNNVCAGYLPFSLSALLIVFIIYEFFL